MKKVILSLIILTMAIILSGCGQELDMTIYNATGISSAGGWVAINANTDGNGQRFLPVNYALSDDKCDSTNSLTYKVKENQTINISGNGQTYFNNTDGTITKSPFTLPNGTKTIYGELLSTPHWYAAVNMDSIVFYKK